MNKISLYTIICIIGISLFSCKSRKDMVFIQDTSNNNELELKSPTFDTYKLRINDNLFIDIQTTDADVNKLFNPTKAEGGGASQSFGDTNSQLLNGYQVDIRGEITLPILGKVNVENLTLDETQAAIQEKALEYLKSPVVKVRLLNFKYTILGEVASPGVYYNYNNLYTILDALSEAQGTTNYSQIRKIKLIRNNHNTSKVYSIDLTKKDFISSELYYLQPNDVIYVEPDRLKPLSVNLPVISLVFSTISTLVLLLNFVNNN